MSAKVADKLIRYPIVSSELVRYQIVNAAGAGSWKHVILDSDAVEKSSGIKGPGGAPKREHVGGIATIHSRLKDVEVDVFRARAFIPKLPIVIRHLSRDAARNGAGIPAISKWFKAPDGSAGEGFQPLNLEYLSPFKDTILPYELMTPILDYPKGKPDVFNEFVAWNALSLQQYLPRSNTTVNDVLKKCADFDTETHVEEIDLIAQPFVVAGKQRLTGRQFYLLQRYGPRFQEFHSFNAPLELMMKASRNPTSAQSPVASELPGLYIAQAQVADLPRALQEDLPLPALLRDIRESGTVDIYGANLWMGTPPTFTPLHKDPNPNLFVQMAGRKTVRLLEPAKGQRLFDNVQRRIGARASAQMRGAEMMQGPERLALRDAVWGDEAKTHELLEVTLEPEDALFIPERWWHSIKSEGSGFNASVNWWFR